jgi:DUF1365 family protein
MEMDYRYSFNFTTPAESVAVQSSMLKVPTDDVWFTANLDLKRLPFSPLNLLYVLAFYPLHTRLIQIWIHWEAVLLFLKVTNELNTSHVVYLIIVSCCM